MAKLTDLQRRTCEIYISMKKPNKTQAYKQAGSKSTGRTLEQVAFQTLKKPVCQAYLAKLRKKSEKKALRTADEIIRELEKIAFSNMENYIGVKTQRVSIKDFNKMTPEQKAAIAEISETKDGHIKFKLYDKPRALKALGLRFGIFPTKVELSADETLAQAIHNAMKEKK